MKKNKIWTQKKSSKSRRSLTGLPFSVGMYCVSSVVADVPLGRGDVPRPSGVIVHDFGERRSQDAASLLRLRIS